MLSRSDKIDSLIKPFYWVDHDDSVSVCLTDFSYKENVFILREDEGFEGNGYDWCSLAKVFISELKPHLEEDIKFDPEASMFCVYSTNVEAMNEFIIGFKETCENKDLIEDLFYKAELD